MDNLLIKQIKGQEVFRGVTELDIKKLIDEVESKVGITLTTRHCNYISGLLRFDKILKDNATKLCYNKLS